MKSKITTEGIRGYKAHNIYATDEIIIKEVESWDANTPLRLVQNSAYVGYEGKLLDIIFSVMVYTVQQHSVKQSDEKEDVGLDGVDWGMTLSNGDYYMGEFKPSPNSVLHLSDIDINRVSDFMAYFLVDGEDYTINNTVIDKHSYKVEGRYFHVGKLLKKIEQTNYYSKCGVTRNEVICKIENRYITQLGFLYGEDIMKKGLIKVKKHLYI